MLIRRRNHTIAHHEFRDLPSILGPEDFLVINTTRVFPARLRARRSGRAESIEVLLLREENPGRWNALVRPGRKAEPGEILEIGDLTATVLEIKPDGTRILAFEPDHDVRERLEALGEPPLPPYIRRQPGEDLRSDRVRYQTVFARESGSVAAPTAGLHFTPKVLQDLDEKGVPICEILLHVGYGTFQPVRCQQIERHRMIPEYFEVSATSATAIRRLRSEGRHLIAVGTTTTRVLEHLAHQRCAFGGETRGFCDLFIYPGFEFRMLDGLLTNFHLPKSTLFMLVCAFAGRDFMLECYREATACGYRFFSYGDCMLIL